MVPATVVFQLVVMCLYLFVNDPTSVWTYLLATVLAGSGFSVSVSMMAYIVKRIPKMVRGMTIAVVSVASCIGSIIYLQIYAHLAALNDGTFAKATFVSTIIIDVVVLIALAVFVPCGWYGYDDGGHG